MADGEGKKYIRRLVARKRKVRFVCTLDEAVRYSLVMRTRIAYRFPEDGTMLRSVFTYKAGCSFLPYMPNLTSRVVIDGGAASGDSSVALTELTPKKVLAFEPSPVQRSEIKEVLRQNGFMEDIEIMPYALSDRNKVIRIADQHGEVFEVNAVTIDEISKEFNVGLIKLEVIAKPSSVEHSGDSVA
ncbi:MAG: FkbM family methyltransferase, partial [Kiritimatiellia bacterium]